jgi:hypothetical protein
MVERPNTNSPQWMAVSPHGGFSALPLYSRRFYAVRTSFLPSHLLCKLEFCYRNIDTHAGFPLSFGVFQDYYSKLPQFANSPYIGVIGTIAFGLGYIGAPVVVPFVQRYKRWQRQMIWLGCEFTLNFLHLDQ